MRAAVVRRLKFFFMYVVMVVVVMVAVEGLAVGWYVGDGMVFCSVFVYDLLLSLFVTVLFFCFVFGLET